MRYPDDMARAQGSRGGMSHRARTISLVVVGVVVVLVLSARAIAGFFTDYLWFDSLGVTGVWRTRLLTEFGLGAAFSVLFFLVLWANLTICDRAAPEPGGVDDELLNRYNELVGPRRRPVRILIAALFGLIAGVGASGQWNTWLLFRHGGSFGATEPIHGRDLGFYVFKLPFISYIVNWAFATMIVVLLVVTVSHYLNGAIRLQVSGQRFTPTVKAHLSVLLAILAILKAADYMLQRYALLFSDRGVVQGATYTDVNAALPALGLLILISLLSAVLFIINIRRRGWALPVVAIGLWLLVALVAGELYPWFIQSFQVQRKESAKEAPYIRRNIDATRVALGLDKVVEKNFDYTTTPPASAVTDNPETIRNIRLLDPGVVTQTFKNLESQLAYYKIGDLDVDRYPIGTGGSTNQVLLGTRELNPDAIPQDTWEARHLVYTHGYGLALAPANAVTTKGRPDFLVSGVPAKVDPSVASTLPLTRPEIYFGEGIDGTAGDGYAIVKTTRKEQNGSGESTYAGKGGVPVNGFLRRTAFFLRFGDLEALTSEYLTPKSRVLYVRDVVARVKKVAPFLSYDHDPYPVLVNGRIQYVVDAYTTSATFPYAQQADTSQLDPGADLYGKGLNYVRNSVKAVVDAYDGTVKFYLVDDELYGKKDPVARAYATAYPGLFLPLSKMNTEIKQHLRYPEDLFRIQTTMWGRYHISDPGDFYNRSDGWSVAQDAGSEVAQSSGTVAPGDQAFTRPRVQPYYLQLRLPQEKKDTFLLFRPFVPYSDDDSKKQLTSFMVGKSDLSNYGQLEVYTMTQQNADGTRSRNRQVDGPLIVNDNILSSPNVSRELSLLNVSGGGSKVDFGNLLVIPIDQGLLYVRPYYVRADQEGAVPELRRIVVALGDQIEVSDNIGDALQKLFPGATIPATPVVGENGSSTTTTTPPGDVGSTTPTTTAKPSTSSSPDVLIAQALQLFADADAALKAGGSSGLSQYQEKTAQAEELITQAQAALNGGSSKATTTTAGR